MTSAARMWRAEDLGGLELFGATLSEFAFRPHAHEEFFIAVTEVAVETGFYDQAHLTRHFKRIVGLTPGRYVRDRGDV